MNALLNRHGCEFSIPNGLRELMSDISREVIRNQPQRIFQFISNYLGCLLITRENSMIASSLLEDLCDCRPTLSEHLLYIGIEREFVSNIARMINFEIIRSSPPVGADMHDVNAIMAKVATLYYVNKTHTEHMKRIIESTYRTYWYRKKTMDEITTYFPTEPWSVAAERTISIYKKTNPTFAELTRATIKIQAAYRGYHKSRALLGNYKAQIIKHPEPKEVHYKDLDKSELEKGIETLSIIDNFINENKKNMVLKAPLPAPTLSVLEGASSEELVAPKSTPKTITRRNTSLIFGPYQAAASKVDTGSVVKQDLAPKPANLKFKPRGSPGKGKKAKSTATPKRK